MRLHEDECIIAGDRLIRIGEIRHVDLAEVEQLHIVVHHSGGEDRIEGPHAIAALMSLKPSALEGRRMRWARHAWMLHNLVGHPLMQLLSFVGLHRLAIAVHDGTTPTPRPTVRAKT